LKKGEPQGVLNLWFWSDVLSRSGRGLTKEVVQKEEIVAKNNIIRKGRLGMALYIMNGRRQNGEVFGKKTRGKRRGGHKNTWNFQGFENRGPAGGAP